MLSWSNGDPMMQSSSTEGEVPCIHGCNRPTPPFALLDDTKEKAEKMKQKNSESQ